jgi:5-methylcytosine-specific restriction protein A
MQEQRLMPGKALRSCAVPGCPQLTREPRCDAHRRTAFQHATTRHERGYGWQWEQLRRRILERDSWRCRYCGCVLERGLVFLDASATVDHVKPKAEGGTDEESNLVACCRRCQQRKASSEGARATARRRGGRSNLCAKFSLYGSISLARATEGFCLPPGGEGRGLDGEA